jgi:transcriptional regulator with XRE-family HTH domain
MSYDIYAAFAKRLEQICDEKGLPQRGRQAELARMCSIKPSSVNKWFSAVSLPDPENLLKIADWAGTTVDWLVYGRGSRSPVAVAAVDPRISHVIKILSQMEDHQRDQAVKIVDTLAEPARNPGTSEANGTHGK